MRPESDDLVILLPEQGELPGPVDRSNLRERAIQSTSCSFTISDATDPELPLLWVNPAFTLTTGYSVEEAIGRNCRFLQGPGTDPARVQELRTALAAGRDATVVLLNYRKDGTSFWNQVAISPVRDDSGQLTHFVGAQTDVTERVEADQRLALLAAATSLLADTLDLDEAMDRLTHLLVPELADGMLLTLTDPPGAPPRVFVQHRDRNTDLLDHLLEQLGAADGPTSAWQQLPAEPQLVNPRRPARGEQLTPRMSSSTATASARSSSIGACLGDGCADWAAPAELTSGS